MLRYRAVIEYDGSAYLGFQRQRAGQPTIQEAIENALFQITHQPIPIVAAGRTDTGVHAVGQVISFRLTWRHGVEALQRALNVTLPKDICLLRLDVVPTAFHPRFDARRRGYVYHIYNGVIRRPLKRLYSWHVPQSLDVVAMNEAAQHLIGVHDFATFGKPPQGNNSVREVFQSHWRVEGEMVLFHIEATAFLQRMVRSVVGCLKLVGDGKWSVDDFVVALRACDRDKCGTVAPPHGLYLVSVDYLI